MMTNASTAARPVPQLGGTSGHESTGGFCGSGRLVGAERVIGLGLAAGWSGELVMSGHPAVVGSGLFPVARAMQSIRARIGDLRAQQANLTTPEHAPLAADAVTEFEDAVNRNDLETLRSLIKITFPKVPLTPPRHHNDHKADRIIFESQDAMTTPADVSREHEAE